VISRQQTAYCSASSNNQKAQPQKLPLGKICDRFGSLGFDWRIADANPPYGLRVRYPKRITKLKKNSAIVAQSTEKGIVVTLIIIAPYS